MLKAETDKAIRSKLAQAIINHGKLTSEILTMIKPLLGKGAMVKIVAASPVDHDAFRGFFESTDPAVRAAALDRLPELLGVRIKLYTPEGSYDHSQVFAKYWHDLSDKQRAKVVKAYANHANQGIFLRNLLKKTPNQKKPVKGIDGMVLETPDRLAFGTIALRSIDPIGAPRMTQLIAILSRSPNLERLSSFGMRNIYSAYSNEFRDNLRGRADTKRLSALEALVVQLGPAIIPEIAARSSWWAKYRKKPPAGWKGPHPSIAVLAPIQKIKGAGRDEQIAIAIKKHKNIAKILLKHAKDPARVKSLLKKK